MSNQLAVLPLYLAWQSVVPQNILDIDIIDVTRTPQPMPKESTKLPEGYTVFPDLGVAYKLYRENRTWNDARKYCIGEGANLAVIDSFQKAKKVMDLKGPNIPPDIHIGIHRLFDDTEYVDVKTGSPPKMLPWLKISQINDTSRKCIVVPFVGGGIVASHCTELYNFVCEIPISKS